MSEATKEKRKEPGAISVAGKRDPVAEAAADAERRATGEERERCLRIISEFP